MKKRVYETDSVKYLGVKFGKGLMWKQQVTRVTIKPNKADAMLCKLIKTGFG